MSRLKRRLKNLGLSVIAASIFTSGCTTVYRQPDYGVGGRSSYVENLRRLDDHRAGFDVVPVDVGFVDDKFFVSGYLRNGDVIIASEEVDRSNNVLLRDARRDISQIINLNESSPNSHPGRTIYVTGIYDRDFRRDDLLNLETINVSGELYFTDPVGRCDFMDGFEFWNQPWWRDYNQAHYPIGLRPWWDQNRTGIIKGYHFGISHPNGDWDGDGISNWAERCMGTNPYNRDSDYDGLDDLLELWFGTNPLDRDSDNDGYWDGEDPFPLWHSRHHRNHQHRQWDIWWVQNYENMSVRYKIRDLPAIPGEKWKTKPGRDSERARYKKKLNTREEIVRRGTGAKDYVPQESRDDSRRIRQPKQEEIRHVPERKTSETRKIQPERRVQPNIGEVKPKSKTKEREPKKSESSKQKTKSSGSRRTR